LIKSRSIEGFFKRHLKVKLILFVEKDFYDNPYPQDSRPGQIHPEYSPVKHRPPVEFVAPKYGASASISFGYYPNVDDWDYTQDSEVPSVAYIVGGATQIPNSFPHITNDYSDVEVSTELNVYGANEDVWYYNWNGWTPMPRARIHHISQPYQQSIWVWGGAASANWDRYDLGKIVSALSDVYRYKLVTTGKM
jgi:hypothetical protein